MKTLLYAAVFFMLVMFVGGANVIAPFGSVQASAQNEEVVEVEDEVQEVDIAQEDTTPEEPEPTPEPETQN